MPRCAISWMCRFWLKRALDRRLDRDGAAIEAEADALMTYLRAYSAANHAMW